ncbi:MAG: DUF3037 domain-containing protein [Acaryochloridaceae cyanobacterium RU_4_10]|nr:DUF3037 domain-containing protein [Acaryochloridaceae cyanobacterium RU_4_10]
MASRYSIIQYVPNLIADERINIGVLVFDEQAVRVHFLQHWDRIRCFGLSEDIEVLKNFAHEIDKETKEWLLFPGDRPTNIPVHDRLVKVARDWHSGIQFTEPRGSLAGVDELLDELARTYLLEPPERRQKLRDRKLLDNFKIEQVINKEPISKIYTELYPIFDKILSLSFGLLLTSEI